jgi:hypothetical protein
VRSFIGASTKEQRAPLEIDRGLDNLWTKGGLHYAPPIR